MVRFQLGVPPVPAGFILQTNALSPVVAAGGIFGFTTAYVEINVSKPYKALWRQQGDPLLAEYERRFKQILMGIVASVLVLAVLLVLY